MFLALVSRIERLEAELELSKKIIEKLSPSHPIDKPSVKKTQSQSTLKFSDNDELYDDEPQTYKSLFKSK